MLLHEIVLYRNGQPLGRLVCTLPPIAPGVDGMVQLNPEGAASAASYFRVRLAAFSPHSAEDTEPVIGWSSMRVGLDVDGQTGMPYVAPLTWYDAEPTDWHTGLARFSFNIWPPYHRGLPPAANAPPQEIWTLTIRRHA